MLRVLIGGLRFIIFSLNIAAYLGELMADLTFNIELLRMITYTSRACSLEVTWMTNQLDQGSFPVGCVYADCVTRYSVSIRSLCFSLSGK